MADFPEADDDFRDLLSQWGEQLNRALGVAEELLRQAADTVSDASARQVALEAAELD